MHNTIDQATGEVVDENPDTDVIEALTRAEVDMAVATAKRYPRDIAKFKKEVAQIISDPIVAQGCGYKLPVGDGVEGPSVRLAEILAPCYGNMQIASRTIQIGARSIRVQAVAHDWQHNFRVSQEVERQIVNKNGVRYADHLINRTIMAAQSIARRNVAFQIIPREYVDFFYEKAKEIALSDPEALLAVRKKWLDFFEAREIPKDTVLKFFGVAEMKNLSPDNVVTMAGFAQSVKDGHITFAELFPMEIDRVDEPLPDVYPPTNQPSSEKRILLSQISDFRQERQLPEEIFIQILNQHFGDVDAIVEIQHQPLVRLRQINEWLDLCRFGDGFEWLTAYNTVNNAFDQSEGPR